MDSSATFSLCIGLAFSMLGIALPRWLKDREWLGPLCFGLAAISALGAVATEPWGVVEEYPFEVIAILLLACLAGLLLHQHYTCRRMLARQEKAYEDLRDLESRGRKDLQDWESRGRSNIVAIVKAFNEVVEDESGRGRAENLHSLVKIFWTSWVNETEKVPGGPLSKSVGAVFSWALDGSQQKPTDLRRLREAIVEIANMRGAGLEPLVLKLPSTPPGDSTASE